MWGESCDIITEANSGIPIEPENAAELAEAIIRLADSPQLCQELGQNGYGYVAEHFDRSILAGYYEKVLAGMVANNPQQ